MCLDDSEEESHVRRSKRNVKRNSKKTLKSNSPRKKNNSTHNNAGRDSNKKITAVCLS